MLYELLKNWDDYYFYGHRMCRIIEYRNVLNCYKYDLEYPKFHENRYLELDEYVDMCTSFFVSFMQKIGADAIDVHEANDTAIQVFNSIQLGHRYNPKWGWGELPEWNQDTKNKETEIDQTVH